MADDTKVLMTIPEDIIRAQVQAAIGGVLQARGDDLIAAMVREVFAAPARDHRGDEVRRYVDGRYRPVSRFALTLEETVHAAVKEELKAWIEEQRDQIRKAIKAHLGRTAKATVASIADRIIDKLSDPHVSLSMHFGETE